MNQTDLHEGLKTGNKEAMKIAIEIINKLEKMSDFTKDLHIAIKEQLNANIPDADKIIAIGEINDKLIELDNAQLPEPDNQIS